MSEAQLVDCSDPCIGLHFSRIYLWLLAGSPLLIVQIHYETPNEEFL